MMKRIMIVCMVALSLCRAHASVLLNEHFDRGLGTLSASTWSSGELPNDGNWHTYSPGSVQFQVVAKQLQKADYCAATSGKAVEYSANHSRDYILFDNAVTASAGKKVLLAFLLKAGGLQTCSNAMSASNANNSIISVAINASNNAMGSLNGRVIIQTVNSTTFKLGVSRRGETPQFAADELHTGTTYLVVAEYAFVDGEKNDLVSLYINPTPAVQTVAVTSVNPATASADADKLVGVALCSNGNTPTDMLLDEVRVATSWEELWEDSTAPTPVISTAISLAFGQVTLGEPSQQTLTVKGANLKGNVSVVSDNADLVPAVSSIAQADAEATDGYALGLTLTATAEGEGSAHLTFKSEGASDNTMDVTWTAVKPAPPAGTELLQNGSFEDYSCNAMFGCSFDGWNLPLGSATAEETDLLDGAVAMQVNPNTNANLDQGVLLNDADYAAGTLFLLKMHYKVLSLPESATLDLDCYWEPVGGGDAEAMKAHEADFLQRTVATAANSEWQELELITSKPVNSSYFRVRFKVPKNAKVLFDDFSLVRTENTEPYILVAPDKLTPVETTIGNSVAFQTIHIKQGNLSGTTTFELSYTDASQFSLSASSLAADQSECDLVITYAPTAAGSHIAYLNIDNLAHPTLYQSIKLQGTCTDPSALPQVTVTPSVVPAFEAVAGQQQAQTIKVKSANCTDFIYLRMEHVTGAAFVIDGTMLSRNTECDVTVTFKPVAEGTYQSTLIIYSQSNEFEEVTLTLNGTASAPSGQTVDWQTEFEWDNSQPLVLMEEHFDNAQHNKPLAIDGWQNVAAADARPWWGLDETQTSLFDGDGKYAKATAYQFGKPNTGDWEMWLVTPALDYKNAENKLFAFSVMGQYLPEEDIQAALEIYYFDPYSATELFRQDLTGSFSIPKTSDEDSQWITFYLDLSPYAETIADVFHMGFRFVGPNGADGAVTYYIDDVSWGVALTDVSYQKTEQASRKLIRDGQLLIIRGDNSYTVLGTRVR